MSSPKRRGLQMTLKAAALVGSDWPGHAGAIYLYLASQAAYTTSPQRQRLIHRLREALIKCIPLTGIPSVIETVLSIVKVERPEDQYFSFNRYCSLNCSLLIRLICLF
jgi:hypothetical protein